MIGLSVNAQEIRFIGLDKDSRMYVDTSTVRTAPISDTIPVFIVYIDKRKNEGQTMYIKGFSVRKQDGYYDATKSNGYTTLSVYTPMPLMDHVKYLDVNKRDIPDWLVSVISFPIK